jgi:hypothetical protein
LFGRTVFLRIQASLAVGIIDSFCSPNRNFLRGSINCPLLHFGTELLSAAWAKFGKPADRIENLLITHVWTFTQFLRLIFAPYSLKPVQQTVVMKDVWTFTI